jgi:O-antigen ligase
MVGIDQVAAPEVGARPAQDAPRGAPDTPWQALAAVPTAVAVVLLWVAVWSDGAFAIRSWGPLAVFALAALAAGRRNGATGPALAMVAALWLFALWSAVSVSWSDRPGAGVEGTGRTLLYAALASLPVLTLPTRRWAERTARLITLAAAGLVALSLAALLASGTGWFVAGRLDEPVGYRNGTGALLTICFWPLISVAATRRGHLAVRAVAFALATSALGMALLTQSRGAVLGFAAGLAVALALGPDRSRRVWAAIFSVGAVALASNGLMAPYDAFADTLRTVPGAVDEALTTLALLAAGSLALGLLLGLVDGGLRVSDAIGRRLRIVSAAALGLLALGIVAAALVRTGDPVAFADRKADEFTRLGGTSAPGGSRLASTGGQRYDLWRIAWREFAAAPVTGGGEGAYPVRYFRERATDANLDNPHSEPLRVLAELGVVGALLLVAALVAAALALVRGWPTATERERRWASALAAAGAVAVGQSAVDWLWLIPGLTGLGVVALATAVAIVSIPPAGAAPPRPARAWTALRVLPALAAVAVSLAYLADVHVRTARADTGATAQQRLDTSRTAERLNPLAAAPRYQQAGALEDLGRRDEARRELLGVLDLEPQSFVALGLLGDLETRAGDRGEAREWYRRALFLNPRDTGLQQLAR